MLGLRINGSIDRLDMDVLGQAFAAKLRDHRPLRIYIEVLAVGPITRSALIEDLRLAVQHLEDVEREAIVAEEGWMSVLARTGNLFPGIEVRHFGLLEKEKALEWINT